MFRDLYKQSAKNRADMQEERRKKLLEEQKQKRQLLQDVQRNVDFRQSRQKAKYNKFPAKTTNFRTLKDAYDCDYSLQLSEWLRERPENLDDWFMMPCPKGQRCLLMASNGRTDMYNKAGRKRMSFNTLLPGDNGNGKQTNTLLDCVYSNVQDTFYVLDALVYGNQELIHCETQFRFFWLRSKFAECEELSNRSQYNEKPLKLLERYDFENFADVSEVLQRFPIWPENEPELDGLLFYHKEASYTCGSTPLVGWLFAFMVSDVLGIKVNENYEKPENYVAPLPYMEDFDVALDNQKLKRKQRKQISKDMDTEDSLCTNNEFYKTIDWEIENSSILSVHE
ncbi:snurportin-1 [Eurosta solidaginis]|uniref:snurportin-1 n=1 Tax=Eurosta solidaginis TaxID=178769 RepID=UPI0035314E2E